MPREQTRRLTLRFSEDAFAKLKSLAEKKNVTVTEAVRQAVAMEIYLYEARDKGERLLIQDNDEKLREILLR